LDIDEQDRKEVSRDGNNIHVLWYYYLMADWELASKGETVFKIDPLK